MVGSWMSEDSGRFLLLQHKYSKLLSWAEHLNKLFNMSYLTDLYIIFTLKMESVFKNTIFGLKMMVKSGLEKNIFKIPPCASCFLINGFTT